MKKKYRNKRGLLGLLPLALMAVVLSGAAPAGAVQVPPETGSGQGTGWTTFGTQQEDPATVPFCVHVPNGHEFTFTNSGTYTATTATGKSTFTGATTTTVETGEYWFNPEGTFGPTGDPMVDGTCTVPVPVDVVSASVGERGTQAGDVDCDIAPGTVGAYSRVGEAFVITFDANCDVTDSSTGVLRTTPGFPMPPTHTLEGAQHPCFPDGPPPPDPCATVDEFEPVTYTET